MLEKLTKSGPKTEFYKDVLRKNRKKANYHRYKTKWALGPVRNLRKRNWEIV